EKTLDSFFEKNTYPIKKIVITEDSTEGKKLKKLISRYENKKYIPEIHLIINEKREGQLKSIDKAYKEVDTEYIFHCEDDWEFLRKGFIEKSISLLEEDPKLLLVGLRGKEDFKEDFFKEEDYISENGTAYYEVKREIFTYNPSLKRKKDSDLFGSHEKLKDELYELALSEFYKKKGYRAVYFKDKYVRHIGTKRHVHFSKRGKNSVLDFKLDRMIKKIRYTILKLFGKIK
ncbi:MAG: glycosyltransferase, partial [Leptotrichiaceae bacterium]|nr:glycosyltransferase [Leptotrichiaceae bacterium]